MKETWQILEPLAVRTTGFPIELLERLRSRHMMPIVRAILDCERDIERQRRFLLDEQFRNAVMQAHDESQGQQILRRLSSWRRAVGHERPVEDLEMLPTSFTTLSTLLAHWNRLLRKREQLLEEGRKAWELDAAESSHTSRALASDARIQEAIFLSNPDMDKALCRYLTTQPKEAQTGARHKFEKRFFMYLQRFCAKNETQSFFGPINYGYLVPHQTENVRIRRVATPLQYRVTFPSQWLAESLATKISAEPELHPFLRPRRSTICLLRDHRLYFPTTGKYLILEKLTAQLFALADGHRTVKCLANQLGEKWTDTWERITDLSRRGAIITDVLIPPDVADPLGYLAAWLHQVPENLVRRRFWCEVIHELATLITALATADLAQRRVLVERLESHFADAIGKESRRGAGTMYADRFLFFEECLGDLGEFQMGGELAFQIRQRLQPILHLAQQYAWLRAMRDRGMAKRILERFPSTESGTPLLAYLQSLAADPPESLTNGVDALDLFLERLQEIVRVHSDGHVARLTYADLPFVELKQEVCTCTSLDLMIAAPDQASLAAGTFQLILGEMHPYPLLWVFPTAYFAREHDTPWWHTLAEGLGQQPEFCQAAQLGFTRKTKIFPYQLPGPTIELRPRYPTCDAISVADVTIQDGENGLRLQAGGQYLRLHTPITRRSTGLDPISPLAFPAVEAPPINLGAHTPRIEIDGVVYQRERWVVEGGLSGAEGKEGFELFLAVWRWKERMGLPDEVFVRVAREPKPIFVDFTCTPFVELLHTISRHNEQLTLTEMWPDTRHLWLDGPEGRHTCECRLVAMANTLSGDAL